MSGSGSYSYELVNQEGRHSVRSADGEMDYDVVRWEDDPQVAVAFPLSGAVDSRPAAVSATLPLCTLPGLRTPLNAPFELTANREALLETSPRNAFLRERLAELFLRGVVQHGEKAWRLQPGPELAQQRRSATPGGQLSSLIC